MGQVTREQAFEVLRAANPNARLALVHLYADAFAEYSEAMDNIGKNGTVVQHPRTGAPIDNPYLRVRDGAAKALKDSIFATLKTNPLWA